MLEKTSPVLNKCHSSVKFTMKTESTPSFSRTECNYLTELFTLRPKSKPTNTGLLLLYQSHVDMRYRRGLLKTMLDRTRAYRISSCWSFLFWRMWPFDSSFLPVELSTTSYQLNCEVAYRLYIWRPASNTCPKREPKGPNSPALQRPRFANLVRKQLNDMSLKSHTVNRLSFLIRSSERKNAWD